MTGEKITAEMIKINLTGIKTVNIPIKGPLPICPKDPSWPFIDIRVALFVLSVIKLLNHMFSKGSIIFLDKLIIIIRSIKMYPLLIAVIKHSPAATMQHK